MAQKDVGNKVPIYKLKKTEEVMKYYDEWGTNNKYDQDMVDWDYTGPKETVEIFKMYANHKEIKIYDAGCGTGLVGVELKKYGYNNFDGVDLSQKLLDLVPNGLYKNLLKAGGAINFTEENFIKLFKDKAKVFFKKNGLLLNWKEFEKLDQSQQINTLAMIAPVSNEEKQKLLETKTIIGKTKLMLEIIEFYLHASRSDNKTLQ